MESWRRIWRNAATLISTDGLLALKKGLEENDQRILQGATTTPPPLQCVQDCPVEAACPVAYAGWQGQDLETVAEVEEYFARMSFEIDKISGEPAACRYLYAFIDETPRASMIKELFSEVTLALEGRNASV